MCKMFKLISPRELRLLVELCETLFMCGCLVPAKPLLILKTHRLSYGHTLNVSKLPRHGTIYNKIASYIQGAPLGFTLRYISRVYRDDNVRF